MRWTKDTRLEFGRITIDPAQMGGAPCIRGLRIPVATIAGMLASHMSEDEILAAYPDMVREDIHAAVRYDAVKKSVDKNIIEPMRSRIRNLNLPEDDN